MSSTARRVYHSCLIVAYILVSMAYAEPMHTKNHSPVWFGILYPTPDSAKAVKKGKSAFDLQFDYSNIYVSQTDSEWGFFVDMEVAQYTLDARYGFSGGLEAGLELPVFSMGGGFLDQSVLDLHSMFGFSDYRSQRQAPRNRYLYSVTRNGKSWNAPKPGRFNLGDTTLWLKKEFWERNGKVASLKFLAQGPTGSTSDGLGNGSWDSGALLLLTSTNKKFETTFNLGAINPGPMKRGDAYTPKTFFTGHFSLNYFFKRRWTLLAQGSVATSPYADENLLFFRRTWKEITFGFRYRTESGKEITIGFLENLSRTSPDFTMHLSVSF